MDARVFLALMLGGCMVACGNGTATHLGCLDLGPPCGLTLNIEPTLPIGNYTIEVTTDVGMTTCNFLVNEVRHQTSEEVEAEDTMLATCEGKGDCPPDPCTGPSTIRVSSTSVGVEEEAVEVGILIEETETGAVVQQSFAPNYQDHPTQTGDCHRCRVASDSIAAPE